MRLAKSLLLLLLLTGLISRVGAPFSFDGGASGALGISLQKSAASATSASAAGVVVMMTSKTPTGVLQRFCCLVPDIVAPPVAGPLDFATALKDLAGECVDLNRGTWWSYRYCFYKALTQFHDGDEAGDGGDDPNLNSFNLGNYKNERRSTLNNFDAQEHDLQDGDDCDLNGMPRQATVFFQCAHDAVDPILLTVEEVSSCRYRAIVLTDLLCEAKTAALSHVECVRVDERLVDDSNNACADVLQRETPSLGQPQYHLAVGHRWSGVYDCSAKRSWFSVQIIHIWPSLPESSAKKTLFRALVAFKHEHGEGAWTSVGEYDLETNRISFLPEAFVVNSNAFSMIWFDAALSPDGTFIHGIMPSCFKGPFQARQQLQPPSRSRDLPEPDNVEPTLCASVHCSEHCQQHVGQPGPFSEACLTELWAMAGCHPAAKFAPFQAPEEQLRYWNSGKVEDALTDMNWYVTFSKQGRSPHVGLCLKNGEFAARPDKARLAAQPAKLSQQQTDDHQLALLFQHEMAWADVISSVTSQLTTDRDTIEALIQKKTSKMPHYMRLDETTRGEQWLQMQNEHIFNNF